MSIKDQIRAADWTIAAFLRECGGISPHTLDKLEEQPKKVRPYIRDVIMQTLKKIQGEQKAS